MAYTTINKSTDYFNTKLYEGNGSSPRSITGVGFQPDWTWYKNRDATNGHGLFDAVRGYTTGKGLSTHNTNAEGSADGYGYLSSRDSDGYTMTQGGSGMTMNNTNGQSYVSWNWKANGQGSSNTDGSINTTYTSVNTTAGFSISSYTGTGSNATVGHGLGVAPKMVIIKKTSGSDDWKVYHASVGATKSLVLQGTNAETSDSTSFNNTAPTTSVFSVGTSSATNTSGQTYIAYCFAEKTGYSKFGKYIGNGQSFENTFVYTGFKPSLLILKRASDTGNWVIQDKKRAGYNQANYHLYPNLNNAEGTNYYVDFLSNGFKIRDNPADIGGNNDTYIYMAFGQSLVGSNNVPCTAR